MRRLEKNEILDAIAKALADARAYFAAAHGVHEQDIEVSLEGADRIRVVLRIPVTFDVEEPAPEVPPAATSGARFASHSAPPHDEVPAAP